MESWNLKDKRTYKENQTHFPCGADGNMGLRTANLGSWRGAQPPVEVESSVTLPSLLGTLLPLSVLFPILPSSSNNKVTEVGTLGPVASLWCERSQSPFQSLRKLGAPQSQACQFLTLG